MATQLTRAAIDDALTTLLSAVATTGAGTVTYPAKGYGSVVFNVTGSSPVGTITFQGTVDGTNWVSLEAYNVATGAVATTTTAVGVFSAYCAGFELVRANVTAFTSGTWTVAVRGAPTADAAALLSGATATVVGADTPADGKANPTADVPVTSFNEVWNGATWDRATGTLAGGTKVQGPAASGAAKAGAPVQNGGVFNTTQPTVTTGQAVEAQYSARGTALVTPGVEGFAVTSATLATAAKQPALGVDGTPSADVITTQAALPLAANLLSGYARATSTTAATTLITVPAGRVARVSVFASVSATIIAGNTGTGTATATFSTAGTGVTPAAGTFFVVDTRVGAGTAASTQGDQNSNSGRFEIIVVAPVGNSVTVQYASTNAGTLSVVDVSAFGQLL